MGLESWLSDYERWLLWKIPSIHVVAHYWF